MAFAGALSNVQQLWRALTFPKPASTLRQIASCSLNEQVMPESLRHLAIASVLRGPDEGSSVPLIHSMQGSVLIQNSHSNCESTPGYKYYL